LTARPSAALLASRALLGSGLPMLGAYPREREALAAELEQGVEPHAALDLRLSGNLVHELSHGLARECSGPPAPWLVLEAAALHLGATAFPRHAYPEVPGEAVPGISLFVLAGEGLSRLFGQRALRQLLVDAADLSDVFGPRASAALRTAGWQDWLRRREPPFARDASDAIAWVKLADASRAPSPIDAL